MDNRINNILLQNISKIISDLESIRDTISNANPITTKRRKFTVRATSSDSDDEDSINVVKTEENSSRGGKKTRKRRRTRRKR